MLFSDLCNKEVVSVSCGSRLGHIDDIEIDEVTAQIKCVYLYGRSALGGLLARENDLMIDWKDIQTVGPDIILVKNEIEQMPPQRKRRGLL